VASKRAKILTAKFAKARKERKDFLCVFAEFFAISAVKGFGFGEAAPDNIESRLTKQ